MTCASLSADLSLCAHYILPDGNRGRAADAEMCCDRWVSSGREQNAFSLCVHLPGRITLFASLALISLCSARMGHLTLPDDRCWRETGPIVPASTDTCRRLAPGRASGLVVNQREEDMSDRRWNLGLVVLCLLVFLQI